MRARKRAMVSAGALVALMLLVGCVKIETGPQTTEDAIDTASARGKALKLEWGAKLQSAEPMEKVRLWRMFVDSTCANYIRYGLTVADEWQKGNAGRGTIIADSEMQETVDRWNKTQQPMISAYEDVLEYGVEQITKSGAFGAPVLDPVSRLRDQYFQLYSTVFFPKGTVEEYQHNLREARAEIEQRSLDLDRALNGR